MKALVKYAKGPGNLEIREVEEPKACYQVQSAGKNNTSRY